METIFLGLTDRLGISGIGEQVEAMDRVALAPFFRGFGYILREPFG
jgi:hypothetical protein